jgi:type I restriction enzyme, S subunit
VKTRTVQLGEVCEINPGTDFDFGPDDVCSFVPMEAVDDVDARIERPATRPFKEVAKGYTPFAENDVIVAKITPCMENGKCAIARNMRSGFGFGSTEFHVLRATKHVIPEWLFYFWRFPPTRKLAAKNMTGSAGQKRVPASFVDTVEIPLPPLSEQRRIAGQLEQADRLRRTRRYALELSDTFLPAAFLKLFGDPVRNTKGWPCTELEDIASVDRGKFTPRPRGDPSYYGGKFPFIQTGDISNSGGRLNSWTQTLNEKGVKVSRSFPPRTVVIAIVGATIGMTAILELEVYCTDSVVGIQVDTAKATPEYMEMLLRFWRPVFLAQAPETARANINLDTLRPLRIPIPPLPLQEQFALLVARHERLRAVQRESLRQSEHLFQSLLHHAFTITEQ